MITPLRALMLDQMTLRHLAEKTKIAYVAAVAGLTGKGPGIPGPLYSPGGHLQSPHHLGARRESLLLL